MKALPKPPSEFCLHLAAFKKYVDKFKLSLSLKNHFRADMPASNPRDFVFFSLVFSFGDALSLRVIICLSL